MDAAQVRREINIPWAAGGRMVMVCLTHTWFTSSAHRPCICYFDFPMKGISYFQSRVLYLQGCVLCFQRFVIYFQSLVIMVGVPLSATSLNTCFLPKTDSGPILRDCVKYKCALRLHILSFPSLYPRASLGDDKQLKWNFYAPRPPHTARPAHPKWSR